MRVDVCMPKLGMTMTEGTITKWLKKEGDFVTQNEPIVEIETQKIVNSVDSPATGILEKIMFTEGNTVKISTVIAIVNTEAESRNEGSGFAHLENDSTEAADNTEKVIAEKKPYAGIRKIIGERMSESLRISPQGTMTVRADMTGVLNLKSEYESKGQKVSVTDIMVKIAALAIERNPILNASIENDEIVIYKSVNIGIAVGTEDGLFVPVIHHVEEKDILQIAAESKELVQKVKENRLQSNDMSGGTFTISNLGMYDVDVITAIINPPESAILAIGATRKEVVVDDSGTICTKPLTTLSLTGDHRVADGIPVVKFLKDMKEIMENPADFIGL